MRRVVAACAALSLAVVWSGEADAASARKHKKKQYSARQSTSAGYADRAGSERYRTNVTPDWYPRDSSQLPFGSKLWWEQKERESGGGNRD